jgi:hypothetical protein
MDYAFRTKFGNIQKLLDIPDGSILYVYGFKETTTKFGPQKILVCSKEETLSEKTDKAYFFDVYWSVTIINKFIEKYKSMWKQLDNNDRDVVCYGTYIGICLFKFRKVGFKYNQSRNKYVLVEILNPRRSQIEDISFPEISFIEPFYGKTKDCSRIDKLIKNGTILEGDIITITKASTPEDEDIETQRRRKNKQRVLCNIEHKDNNYNIIANYWLKEIYLEMYREKENLLQFSCIVGPEKYTPNYTAEHTFYKDLQIAPSKLLFEKNKQVDKQEDLLQTNLEEKASDLPTDETS